MGRHGLRLTIVLGVIITALGSTGIFAAFTDSAQTGTNSAQSGQRQQAVDLKISTALASAPIDCDGDQDSVMFEDDNLQTGIFSVTNLQPGAYPADATVARICLLNAGSGTIDVDATVIELVDTDSGCTGDESAAGDTTCGSNQLGELSGVTAAQIDLVDCDAGVGAGLQSSSLANWPANPVSLPGSLIPGDIVCVAFYLWIPASTDETTLQIAQSDTVTWRFAFDASLAP